MGANVGWSVSVTSDVNLQVVISALKNSSKTVQGQVRGIARGAMTKEYTQGVRERSETRLQQRMLADTARVTVSNQNIGLSVATVGGSLPGGLNIGSEWGVAEYGANRSRTTTYPMQVHSGRNRGKVRWVTRHTTRQLPLLRRGGWAATPTVKEMAPRFRSLWIQTAIKTVLDALEGRS